MGKRKKRNLILPICLLSGTILGAGIFSLPYVFSQLGFLNGIFFLLFFAIVYCVIHLMYGMVLREQSGEHQFFYLAKKYFSPRFSSIASLVILAELIFILLVYLVLAPQFLSAIFGTNQTLSLLIFWLVASLPIFMRLEWIGALDFIGVLLMLGTTLVIFGESFSYEWRAALFQPLSLATFFLPFGPLLFSLSGRPALHKVHEALKKIPDGEREGALRRTVLWGTFIPAVVYAMFAFSVLKINPAVPEEALGGLTSLPFFLFILLNAMGFIAIWKAYAMIGSNVRDILRLDLKLPLWMGALIVLLGPLALYLLGFKTFFFAISFAGDIFLGLEGITVVRMWQKAFPRSKWRRLSFALYPVFICGIMYGLLSLLF